MPGGSWSRASLSCAEKKLQLGDLRGHGVFASRRLRVVAGAEVLAPRGGEVLAVLRVTVVGERLEEHRGNVGPAVGVEVGACCLAEGADVDRVGRKGKLDSESPSSTSHPTWDLAWRLGEFPQCEFRTSVSIKSLGNK